MSFPDDVLARNEEVKLHTRQHWKDAIAPVLWFVVFLLIASILIYLVPESWGSAQLYVRLGIVAVFVGLIVWLSVLPWIRWQSTHYVLTNQRVMWREGIAQRESTHVMLNRVNSVTYSQSIWERLLGFGTLTIYTASDDVDVVWRDIPRVDKVKTQLYQLMQDDKQGEDVSEAR
ncbi:PH domain-containing protein [Haloglycomyces albus]|uniref:PH domain-containing protein n=1 Tax=Haloglycomyces albus TaxID=526067 RepID=UPI00046C9B10|nr:PH domain-containing protein [Haloglycomyces albus]